MNKNNKILKFKIYACIIGAAEKVLSIILVATLPFLNVFFENFEITDNIIAIILSSLALFCIDTYLLIKKDYFKTEYSNLEKTDCKLSIEGTNKYINVCVNKTNSVKKNLSTIDSICFVLFLIIKYILTVGASILVSSTLKKLYTECITSGFNVSIYKELIIISVICFVYYIVNEIFEMNYSSVGSLSKELNDDSFGRINLAELDNIKQQVKKIQRENKKEKK